jgi:hypothetical protein
MRRRLLNLLTTLSLLLCVAACVLWVRGFSHAEFFRWSGTRTEWEVASSRGRLAFQWERIHPRRGTYFPGFFYSAGEPLSLEKWGYRSRQVVACITWYGDGEVGREDPFFRRAAGLPAIVVALVLGVLPFGRFVRHLRLRLGATSTNACAQCSYDLRATPGRCPECGAAAP